MKIIWRTFSILILTLLVVAGIVSFVGIAIYGQLPSEKEIRGCIVTKMYEVKLCPGSNDYVKLSQISSLLQRAVIISEDASFYSHQGFDFQELQNSFKKNVEKGHFVRGGSTISQQLAKNLFLSKEKTINRKLMEALITIKIEKTLTKKEIFERYLNVVQFGKDIYGVKKASQFYFKKNPSDLNALESSFLTMLLPNPIVYSKSFYIKHLTPFARSRIATLIAQLHSVGKLDDDQYASAKTQLSVFLSGGAPVGEALKTYEGLDEESAPTGDDALDQELLTPPPITEAPDSEDPPQDLEETPANDTI